MRCCWWRKRAQSGAATISAARTSAPTCSWCAQSAPSSTGCAAQAAAMPTCSPSSPIAPAMTRAMPSTQPHPHGTGLAPLGHRGRGAGAHRALVSWQNEDWWRPLLSRQGVGQRLGTGHGMTGILVFGRTGQVAPSCSAWPGPGAGARSGRSVRSRRLCCGHPRPPSPRRDQCRRLSQPSTAPRGGSAGHPHQWRGPCRDGPGLCRIGHSLGAYLDRLRLCRHRHSRLGAR